MSKILGAGAGGFIDGFVALDAAANIPFERDAFTLLEQTLLRHGIHGFFRRTFSSTLNKNAEEYDIYRIQVPDYIS